MTILEVRELSLGVAGRQLLDGAVLTVRAGESVAVVGPSGSGKTSLLNCAAGIAVPDSGEVMVAGSELSRLNVARRSELRLKNVGIVFQFGELLPELTAVENVALPLRLSGVPKHDAHSRAADWLGRVEMPGQAGAHPAELSGGEIQRVGIARALAGEPALVLADEPTGMLDEDSTKTVVALLIERARQERAALVVATHDPGVAAAADRVVRIRDCQLVADSQ